MAENDKMQALYGSFKRLRDFPLDPSCIFETKEQMVEYIEGRSTAYPGQVVVTLTGTEKGIYYIIQGNEKLSYVKAIDIDDEAKFLEEFEELKDNFDQTRESLGQSLADMYAQIGNEFVTKTAFEKVTNLNTAEIEEIVDSLGEVILILNDFNTALYHAPSFKRIISDINKIRKLIPVELNDSIYDTEFNPTNEQKLVTNSQLNEVKEFTQHSEKVEVFTFGPTGSYWKSGVLGHNNSGFTITELKIVIDKPAEGVLSTLGSFNVKIAYNNKQLIPSGEFITGSFYNPENLPTAIEEELPVDALELTEDIIFIYDLNEKATQDTFIECNGLISNLSGKIFIKYFE